MIETTSAIGRYTRVLPCSRGESLAIDHPWATSRRRHFTLAHTNHCQRPLQWETDESVSASGGVIVGYAASSSETVDPQGDSVG